MKTLIVGSIAAYHWLGDKLHYRVPKDIDILTPAAISSSDRKICNIESQWHELAEEIIFTSEDKVFCDLTLLYTLKLSHSYWDIHWDKTIFDIVMFKRAGASLNQDLHDRLVKMWCTIHGDKKVNMNKRVDEFFTSYVDRAYDHELLHELVAFNQTPMHTKIRPNLESVWVDKNLFYNLTVEQQIETCLEEITVIAIERGKLTSKSSLVQKMVALSKAHKLLITSMTKGWFAQFLVQNTELLMGNESKKRCITQIDKALTILEKSLTS